MRAPGETRYLRRMGVTKRRSGWNLLITALSAGVWTGCGDAAGPSGSCMSNDGLELCVDRDEYRPGSHVSVELRNSTSETIHVDLCAAVALSRATVDTFGVQYSPARRCGLDPTPEEIRSRALELTPGAVRSDVVTVSAGIPQGFYRAYYWRLDASGQLASPDPARSPEFDVFPSAG